MKMHRRNSAFSSVPRSRQGGAVLYVALIMLILLALLGIVGMQVTGMQERMSANYRAVNVAFQNAESKARTAECYLDNLVNRRSTASCTPDSLVIEEICETDFDATSWAQGLNLSTTPAETINMRSIGKCISGQASLAMGRAAETGGDPNPVYQVTAYATDATSAAITPSADAAVDTLYMP